MHTLTELIPVVGALIPLLTATLNLITAALRTRRRQEYLHADGDETVTR